MPRAAKGKKPNAYHHGDLHAALLAAARQHIEREGAESLSLKALATQLRVSQPAPYRHFADREALLRAVATLAFADFAAALSASGGEMVAMARAYVKFAQAHRGLYRLMFVSNLVPRAPEGSPIQEAANASFALVVDCVAQAVKPAAVQKTALGIWAALHGLVMLESEGFLRDSAMGEDLDVLVLQACAPAMAPDQSSS